MLIGQLAAGHRLARIDADDARAILLRVLQIRHGAGPERAIPWAPAPHQDECGVDVIRGLPPRGFVFRPVGGPDGEDLRLGRHVGPQIGAAAEHVEEPLRRHPPVQQRLRARARPVQDRRVPVCLAHPQHLPRHGAERLVPGDARELAGAARAGAAHRVLEPVGMIGPLDLSDAAGAGGQGRMLGVPAAHVGADAGDPPVRDMGVDHAAPAAIMAAGAGDHRLPGAGGGTRGLVEGVHPEGGQCVGQSLVLRMDQVGAVRGVARRLAHCPWRVIPWCVAAVVRCRPRAGGPRGTFLRSRAGLGSTCGIHKPLFSQEYCFVPSLNPLGDSRQGHHFK